MTDLDKIRDYRIRSAAAKAAIGLAQRERRVRTVYGEPSDRREPEPFDGPDRRSPTRTDRRKAVPIPTTKIPQGDVTRLKAAADMYQDVIDDNKALRACCETAATEILSMAIDQTDTNQMVNSIAAIIYKHMRNGREL